MLAKVFEPEMQFTALSKSAYFIFQRTFRRVLCCLFTVNLIKFPHGFAYKRRRTGRFGLLQRNKSRAASMLAFLSSLSLPPTGTG